MPIANKKPMGGIVKPRNRGKNFIPGVTERRRVAHKARELAARNETPLDTMSDNYLFFMGLAREAQEMMQAESLGHFDTDNPRAMMLSEKVKGYRLVAQACAVPAAPYCHPRLAAHYIKDSSERPLQIVFDSGDEGV